MEVLGREAVLGQRAGEQAALQRVLDVREARARQAEGRPQALDERGGIEREQERPLDAREHGALGGVDRALHGRGDGPVPQVRLVGVQVDQAHARGHERERAGEVVGLEQQVLEDRAMHARAQRDAAAGLPIAPALGPGLLEALLVRRIVARDAGHERAQRAGDVAAQQLERDPTLVVAQVAEALLVEVVDHARAAHELEVLAQALELGLAEVAHDELEGVAQAVGAGQLFGRAPDGLDAQVGRVVLEGPAGAHAHVLHRDALAVLEPGDGHVASGDADLLGQRGGGLERGQLALRDAVDAVLAARGQIVGAQQFTDAEVADPLFELHRGGLTLASCFRTRSKSRGRGASTVTSSAEATRGKVMAAACRVRRRMSAPSGRPGLGR